MSTNERFNHDVVLALADLASKVGDAVLAKRTTCLTCVHFDQPNEGCIIAKGQRPPARVIAYGCAAYVDDGIPF